MFSCIDIMTLDQVMIWAEYVKLISRKMHPSNHVFESSAIDNNKMGSYKKKIETGIW